MTDNEIIKALECCSINDCQHCPIFTRCNYIPAGLLPTSALALINRQKAEVERQQSMCQALSKCRDDALREGVKAVRKAKSEAIKEFAERLKEQKYCAHCEVVSVSDIDNLVKEMTEVEE